MKIHDILMEAIEPAKQKKADYIVKQMGDRWTGLPGFESIDDFVDKISNIDPTRNGAMMPWIARMAFKNPTLNKTEDLDRLAGDLQYFEQFKSKLDNKDINSYKSFAAVYTAIEPFTRPVKPTAADRKEARSAAKIAKFKDEILTIHNDGSGWIRIPTTKGAAQFIGQGTRWCTSAKCSNMFDHYNDKGRLFIIYDKASKERFQLQVESTFADSADNMHDFSKIPEWAKIPVVTWYKANTPNMTLDQTMRLAKIANLDNDDEQSDHSDLLKLMRQYDI